ncbi:outer membrane lipoprotein chaperone LolA [Glaciecola sp. XM2]|uniref:outer membrane lipoprotein chaperone LolA n=1 Tax=Glaciecola sp. XM2 TaxID=1914931 RepID=UPI001BDE4662|nr:outer membrane lipoprotein chaperone LolA [Glaciecola sp. XM2]MBT1449612.1 outer membrane lipoprotein chaperone LolA [Glaciecola sp. XM2]
MKPIKDYIQRSIAASRKRYKALGALCAALCLCIGANPLAYAQSSADVSETQTLAKQELKALLSNLQSYRGEFTQTIEDWSGEVLQTSQGRLTLKKPNQLRWEVTMPDESLFIADGAVVYNVDPFVEQVTLLDQAQIVNNNPLMLLISDDPSAWDDVAIEKSEDRFIVSSTNPNANITELHLRFVDGQLSALVSQDKQRQINRIEFVNAQQNVEVSPDAFFPVYPDNFIVDDQRSLSQP